MYKCVKLYKLYNLKRVMVQNNAYIFQKNSKNINNSYTMWLKVATLAIAAQPVGSLIVRLISYSYKKEFGDVRFISLKPRPSILFHAINLTFCLGIY